MMHNCSHSQGNMTFGACSCGLFHSQSNSFSMPFSMPDHTGSSSSSSVDCTLSLGTPSTRLCQNNGNKRFRHERRSGSAAGSCVSSFRLDLLQDKNKPSRGGNGNSCGISGTDGLLARRCANCDTTSTPLWRNGPRGPKSLCNACGIRFKKEERRAANGSNSSGAAVEQLQRHVYHHQNNPWVHHSQNQKMTCFSSPVNVFWFI